MPPMRGNWATSSSGAGCRHSGLWEYAHTPASSHCLRLRSPPKVPQFLCTTIRGGSTSTADKGPLSPPPGFASLLQTQGSVPKGSLTPSTAEPGIEIVGFSTSESRNWHSSLSVSSFCSEIVENVPPAPSCEADAVDLSGHCRCPLQSRRGEQRR